MLAVIKKELKTYFYSPVGYVFIGLFLLMFSIFFYVDVFKYQSTNFEYIFYSGATILTFIVPVLTMRSIAEERKNGTEQLLLTSPLSITKLVLGKFIAATLIVLITEICIFWNTMFLWKTTYNNSIGYIIGIFIISNELYLIWYFCFKHYRKSNNCRCNYNRIFHFNLVFTTI